MNLIYCFIQNTLVRKKGNHQIPIIGLWCVAINIEYWLFFYISYIVYKDDCHFSRSSHGWSPIGCKHWFKPMLASCGILNQFKGYEKGILF